MFSTPQSLFSSFQTLKQNFRLSDGNFKRNEYIPIKDKLCWIQFSFIFIFLNNKN